MCKHRFTHVNPSTTRPTSRKTGSRVKMTNDKIYQNVPCRGVSHTRSVISLSLRARDQAIMDLKIKRRDGNENVTQK